MTNDLKEEARRTLREWSRDSFRRRGAGLVAGAFVAVALAAALKHFSLRRETTARAAELARGTRVRVAAAAMSVPERSLVLTGELKPYESVTLYAKVGGYLSRVSADKGDHVGKDQVLGVIESPETDRQYDAAKSDADNKARIADRYRPLLEKKLVSQQEADQAFSDAAIALARLGQLQVMKDYEELRAPFDGVVAARFADPGALVQDAENASTGALPVFTVAKTDRLRVTFYVDQKDAPYVRRGTPARVSLSERPEVGVNATVTRTSGSLDDRTRTMLAEVELDNRGGRFVAGGFAQVTLDVKASPQVEIPVEALVTRNNEEMAPVIVNGRVSYRPVVVSDNDGRFARIASGLNVGDKVGLNLGNSVGDGDAVDVLPDEAVASAPKK
ncbi:MAG TPA: efflux RND transporter periplasmic adaptor subunit [Elusimicrobiota bacterium]|nr:efflux RND transporter periplasmic adaptor subunit [Elusimicrobiota bacterium]